MKKALSALLCVALCLVLALAGVAQADIAKPNDDFYYYDDAGVMTDATRAMIYYNNVELQKACGAQIVVAAVRTLGGMTCESYAYQLERVHSKESKIMANRIKPAKTISSLS